MKEGSSRQRECPYGKGTKSVWGTGPEPECLECKTWWGEFQAGRLRSAQVGSHRWAQNKPMKPAVRSQGKDEPNLQRWSGQAFQERGEMHRIPASGIWNKGEPTILRKERRPIVLDSDLGGNG